MKILFDRNDNVFYDYYDSPIGRLYIQTLDEYLVGLDVLDEKDAESISKVFGFTETDLSRQIKSWLERYFKGETVDPDEIPIKYYAEILPPVTVPSKDFPTAVDVYNEIKKIPYGSFSSYGQIAEKVFQDKSYSRYVGSICRRNDILLIVPCHRVLKSNGYLGNYRLGPDVKEQLLQLEGNNGYKKTKKTNPKKEKSNESREGLRKT